MMKTIFSAVKIEREAEAGKHNLNNQSAMRRSG
jgi:hypothetical protein